MALIQFSSIDNIASYGVDSAWFGFDDPTSIPANKTFRIKLEDFYVRVGGSTLFVESETNDAAVQIKTPGRAWQWNVDAAGPLRLWDVTGGNLVWTVSAGLPANSFFMNSTGASFGRASPQAALEAYRATGNVNIAAVTGNASRASFTVQSSAGSFTWRTQTTTGQLQLVDNNAVTIPIEVNNAAPTDSFVISGEGNAGFGALAPTGVHWYLSRLTGAVRARVESLDNDAIIEWKTAGAQWTWNLDSSGEIRLIQVNNASAKPLRIRDLTPADTLILDENGNVIVHGPPTAIHTGSQGTLTLGAVTQAPTGNTPNTVALWSNSGFLNMREESGGAKIVPGFINSTKTTAGAPYTNDGYVTVYIAGSPVRLMTTA